MCGHACDIRCACLRCVVYMFNACVCCALTMLGASSCLVLACTCVYACAHALACTHVSACAHVLACTHVLAMLFIFPLHYFVFQIQDSMLMYTCVSMCMCTHLS